MRGEVDLSRVMVVCYAIEYSVAWPLSIFEQWHYATVHQPRIVPHRPEQYGDLRLAPKGVRSFLDICRDSADWPERSTP